MTLICSYCQKTCKNRTSHSAHERLCPNNPTRNYVSYRKGKPAWNKGLTKETDERVLKNSLSVSESTKGIAPKWEWTEERRKNKSEWRKKLHAEHPETHPNRRLAANKSKWTYPEQVAGNYLQDNGIDYEYNAKIGIYYPDFWIKGTTVLIEIDGAYWHNPEKDAVRDKTLTEMGYKVYRIDSKSDIHAELARIIASI